jgi:basic amino acid/polyamine antiporter, APA family
MVMAYVEQQSGQHPPRPRAGGGSGNGRNGMFATKDVERLVAETEEEGSQLRKAVGALDLTALGIGAIIGTGIFVIIGEAIGDSGPAIVLSFVLAGVTCIFSALSYAELASTIPVAGSAYTYSYATMGELIAWIIGWDLILEYGVSVAAVAVGWGQYLSDLLDSLFGITLPGAIANPPGEGGTVNIPAAFLVIAVAALLIAGVRKSTRTNTVMVGIKLAILGLFIVVAITAFNGDHFSNFAPNGFNGIVDGAALIFFAYIGFDAVSTGSEEAKRPSRDLPIGIIGALVICTIIYIAVALAAVGALPAKQLAGAEAPLSKALSDGAGVSWAANIISFGALIAITSVVLTVLFGQTRIAFSMSRDGLMPRALGKTSARTGAPVRATIIFSIPVAILAALVPLAEIAKLVNIGTLFAFALVNIGVIWLRRSKPDMDRGYRVPFVPVFPLIGIALCVYLMSKLELVTWLRFGGWLLLGVVIYALYGYRHSRLRNAQGGEPPRLSDGRPVGAG